MDKIAKWKQLKNIDDLSEKKKKKHEELPG